MSSSDLTTSSSAARAVGSFFWELIKVFLVAIVIIVPIRYFLIQPFFVRGASMEPNFGDREYLVIDEVSFYLREPERGEVVVFRYPRDPRQFFIKRIIGSPGETIMVKDGYVYIDGNKLNEVYLPGNYLTSEKSFLREEVPYKIPDGYYMVFGDNRDFSSDSREWGPISLKAIVGKAWLRYWPLSSFGLIKHQAYNL